MPLTLTTVPTLPPCPRIDLGAELERHRERLLVLARRFVHCDHAAEDVVQDAMLSALQALPTFEGRARVATWLHRIVVNSALMYLRRDRSRRPVQVDDEQEVPFPDEGPLAAAERADALEHLTTCLDELPAPHRNVIELHDIRETDTAEAAVTLGISENAVRIRLHRARRALRELFDAPPARREPCPVLAMPGRAVARAAG